MPFYEYRCMKCQSVFEELLTFAEKNTFADENYCCEGYKIICQISSFARTPSRWGDQGNIGGYYSQALGHKVANRAEEDRLAEAKGLTRITNYSWDKISGVMDDAETAHNEHNTRVEQTATLKKKYGGTQEAEGRALAEVYSVKNMQKSGLLQDQSIKGD